ncbi:MAG: hypothetical protein OEQ53_09190, partial [Saprospiraceae bacterium]|nr:hypothetical protein [Saprospiraceae bacterium]
MANIRPAKEFQYPLIFWVLASIFLMAAGYMHYHYHKRDGLQKVKRQFEEYLVDAERQFEALAIDTAYLKKLPSLYRSERLDLDLIRETIKLEEELFTIFIFEKDQLLFWSNDRVQKPFHGELRPGNPYYQDRNNFYRSLYSEFSDGSLQYQLVGLIPVRLGSEVHPYAHIAKSIPSSVSLSAQSGIPISTVAEEEFIYVNNPDSKPLSRKEVSVLLFLYGLAAISIAALIQQISNLLVEKVGIWYGVGFFIFTAVAIRFITHLLEFTKPFTAAPIFDPVITSPAFTTSLGDLLINILIFLWITIFLINRISPGITDRIKLTKQLILCYAGYLSIFVSLIWLSRFCQNLIRKTSINFDFESVFNLDQLSIYALVGIILLLFTLFIWSAKIVSLIQKFGVPLKFKVAAGLAALLSSLPILFTINPSIALFQFVMVAGIFILLMDVFLEVKTPNFTWIVLWLVVLSGFSSILLFKYNKDKDIALRTMIAKQLTERVDTVALNEMTHMIEVVSEPLEDMGNSPMIYDMLSTTIGEGSSYLDNYYRISFPNQDKRPIDALEINHLGRRFYQVQHALDQYLTYITLDEGHRLSLRFEKRTNNPYTPVPSLVPVSDFKGISSLENYEYAIYENGRCIERSSSDYKMFLDVQRGEQIVDMQYKTGWSDLIYRNGEYTTMIGRKLTSLIKPVSLFSYLFVVIVIIIFFLLAINTFIPYLPQEFNFTLSNQISLRNKIQVSVLALIVLSFIIIGIVTVFYFQDNAEKSNIDRLKEKASALQYEVQEKIKNDKTHSLDSVVRQ